MRRLAPLMDNLTPSIVSSCDLDVAVFAVETTSRFNVNPSPESAQVYPSCGLFMKQMAELPRHSYFWIADR